MATATATAFGCRTDVRPTVHTYSPNMWGDTFSTFSLDDQVQEMCAEAMKELKKEARSKLMSATSGKVVILIDTIERLGLAYHFEPEIEEKLEEIYNFYLNPGDDSEGYDLLVTALQFRLLRQHQYHVSCSVLGKFMDKDKKFKESISDDIEGLLSLYEAANVQIHGEDILEEALAFAVHHLNRKVPELKSSLREKVKQALEQPLHKGIPIVHVRQYISIYETDDSRDELLLKLAKLNFNYLQNLYKKELCELLRWWDKFELKSKLPFIRDRMVECYLWGMAFRFEPHYSYVRSAVAISMQMQAIMDDTYDNYATIEEAQLFTDLLERWNMDEIDPLPDWMKIVYEFIMSVYEDYEREATEKEKSFAVPYARETVKQIGRAYNQELKWLMEGHIPSVEEHFANSVMITSCIYVFFTVIIPGMKSVTEENIHWLLSEPKIVIPPAKIGRLLDDLVSHERESRGGEMITMLDCRTKYNGVPEEENVPTLVKQAEDAWKDLNTEWVLARTNSGAPKDMVEQFLNYARAAQITYGKSDGFTNPENVLAPHIIALLGDPIVI